MNYNSERTDAFRSALEAAGLDCAVFQLPENVLFLSGFWPMIGMSVLLFPVSGKPVCIIPDCYRNEVEGRLWEADAVFYGYGRWDSPDPVGEIIRVTGDIIGRLGLKRIGIEMNPGTAAVSWNSAEFVSPLKPVQRFLYEQAEEITDNTPVLQEQKLHKTDYEAERIRHANEAACIGMSFFMESAVPGITGVELAAGVEHAIMTGATLEGSERVRAYAQVSVGSGETSIGFRPNEISTARKLESGEIALLELGVTVDGYWADRTRAAVAGIPSQKQKEILRTVIEAQEAAVEIVRPGITAGEVDSAARSLIDSAGYGEYFPHICGHGVGFGYHEAAPFIKPDSGMLLEEGMVFTIEPGIYIPGIGGIRIEDNILVKPGGAEVLGPFRKSFSES